MVFQLLFTLVSLPALPPNFPFIFRHQNLADLNPFFLPERLLNYTPQATIVRLLAINALNSYLTSWVLYLSGGAADPRLLLPAWIGIATALTALYHLTQRKINIRKETSTSISVFSGASFISMVTLLLQLHLNRAITAGSGANGEGGGEHGYPEIPIVVLARRAWGEMARIAGNLLDIANVTRDL